MTATLEDVTKKKAPVEEPAELQAARELVRQAKAQGLSLIGPDGLLKPPRHRPPLLTGEPVRRPHPVGVHDPAFGDASGPRRGRVL